MKKTGILFCLFAKLILGNNLVFNDAQIISTSTTFNACLKLSNNFYMYYSFNNQTFTNVSANSYAYQGNYTFFYSSDMFTSYPSSDFSKVNTAYLTGYSLNSGFIYFSPKTISNNIYQLQVTFQNAYIGFKIGNNFRDLVSISNQTAGFNFRSNLNTVASSAFRNLAVTFNNQNALETTSLSFSFYTPCGFLPSTSIIGITLPQLNTNLASGYNVNSWNSFSVTTCNITINETIPSQRICSISNGTLYISNWTQSNIIYSTMRLVINGVKTPPGFLSDSTFQMYNLQPTASNMFLFSKIYPTINQIILNISNQNYQPKLLNQAGLVINFKLNSALKIPLPTGYKIDIQIPQALISSSFITTFTNVYNGVSNSAPNPIPSGNTFTFITNQDYLLDFGIQISISNLKTPTISGVYILNVVVRTSNNVQIAPTIVYSLTF